LKFIKDLEKERGFSIFPSLMGRSPANPPARPSPPAPHVAQQPATVAQRLAGRAPAFSGEFDPLSEDPAR
jgi:hypothetical protein